MFTLRMSKLSDSGDFGECHSSHIYVVKRLSLTRPSHFPSGFAVTGHIDGQKNSRIYVNEVLPDGLAFNEGVRFGDTE